jgi:cellulose biosynthesis protein BcsQ
MIETTTGKPGQVTTFYSYKGGVGRTFLLANVGWLLARWGRRVLCVDWDLEAPGLHRYLAPEAPPREGVLDLAFKLRAEAPLPAWRELAYDIGGPWSGKGALHLIGAGRRDETYTSKVQGLSWQALSDQGFEAALEELRAEWVADYDHVLVDSRTGITDAGGICAAQLPDLLVVVFTASHQSLEGAVDVAGMAQQARERFPVDRGTFPVLPVPCRIHTGEEEELEKEWANHFETQLAPLFAPWKDRNVPTREYVAHLRVREQARWSFGEQLPVRTEALDDPNRISYVFANVAALVDRRLEDSGALVRQRHDYVAGVAGKSGVGAPDARSAVEHDVYISGVWEDSLDAAALAEALRARGVTVFPEVGMPMGALSLETLYRAREHSRMFLVLLGESEHGPILKDEIAHITRRMTERGVTVVPIFLTRAAITRAPPELADLFGMVLPDDGPWDRIARRIASRLRPDVAREVRFLEGPEVTVEAVAVGTESDVCVSSYANGLLVVWELGSGTHVRSLGGHQKRVNALAVTDDGHLCFSGADDGFVKIWDTTKGEEVVRFENGASVRSLAIWPDGSGCIIGLGDGNINVWFHKTALISAIVGRGVPVRAVATSARNRLWLAGFDDGTLRMWNLDPIQLARTVEHPGASISALAMSRDGDACVVGFEDGGLRLLELPSGKLVRSFAGHTGSVNAVAVGLDGRLCVSASGRTLMLWDLESGRLISSLKGHAPFKCLALTAGSPTLTAGDTRGHVHVYELTL